MTDQHPENNKVLHELMGKDWHDPVDSEGHCSCGKMHSKKLWPDDLNPDYADDPRLVLKERRETVFFRKFLRAVGQRFMFVDYISVDLILDRTGRLRDMAIEFLEKEGK